MQSEHQQQHEETSPAERREAAAFHHAWDIAVAQQQQSTRERWSVERDWAERVSRQDRARMLDSETALAAYLTAEWEFWGGRAPTEAERAKIARTASVIWASRAHERAVAVEAPAEPAYTATWQHALGETGLGL